MKNVVKKTLSAVLAVILAVSAFSLSASSATVKQDTVGDYHLAKQIKDGAILHAWSWSFNTIKENLPLIAQSGYTSVQTSPINQCKVGEGGGMQLYGNGKWYYHYQPTLYTIGNYQLGTLDEFKDMCSEADKYGIKIIVDAVVNHCSSDYSAISSEIKNIEGGAFHSGIGINTYSSRYQVTQGNLLGLYDLNTQNPNVQQMVLNYLKECVAAGADGFRYDAAKHIELPDDAAENGKEFASDFWEVILDNGSEFQYGEILQGGDRIADYAKIMNVTASSYGENLRSALSLKKISARVTSSYRAKDVDNDRLVTWVESHDNYTGDGTWSMLDNRQIRQGWAIIASRGDTTPLFFNRPDGSSTTDQWGKNQIGIRGDDNFFHPEVTAVNHFRNAMIGQPSKIGTIDKNYTVAMIQRGDKGAVIVNVSDNDFVVDCETDVADGTYTDEVTNAEFTVENGKLRGTVKAGAVAVIYNRDSYESLVGDVNLDGNVDVTDATYIQMKIANLLTLEPEAEANADTNGDGNVDVTDATYVQMYIAKILTVLGG